MTKNQWLFIGWSVLMFSAGAGFGYWNWHPQKVAVIEVTAPTVKLAPTPTSPRGGEMAARGVDPAAKPKQSIPHGLRPERVISVDISPDAAQQLADEAATPCPKVHIDATVVRDADGAGRVLISSPDGIVTYATDTVIQSMSAAQVRPWAVGASIGTDKTYGGWIDRDFGRIRTGIDIFQDKEGSGGNRFAWGARAHLGFTFGG